MLSYQQKIAVSNDQKLKLLPFNNKSAEIVLSKHYRYAKEQGKWASEPGFITEIENEEINNCTRPRG